jgi:mRNA-degrading endonuclease RelE of RelBE toxin-antitoxin system
MGSYQIEWKRSAAKELRRLPRNTISRVDVVGKFSLAPHRKVSILGIGQEK